MTLPSEIDSDAMLDDVMSAPPLRVVDVMRRLDGDLIVLGIGGKMGVDLGRMALRASREAGVSRRIIGVSRFSDAGARARLEASGIETVACDLLDREAVSRLPAARNVVFMAGKKFGTDGDPDETWVMNTVVPANVAQQFQGSRIVAYSTGCVYAFVPPESGGSRETDTPAPVGDYAQSALGRERVFAFYARTRRTPTCLVRLNYAVDLRYGVLHDIGSKVLRGEPVDVTMGYVNVIWQGDAIAASLGCLDHCAVPASVMNVTGPEIISVRSLAEAFGRRFGRAPVLRGTENPRAYLNNAARSFAAFGRPSVSVETLLDWTAHWLRRGGRTLGKPTHFETTDGRF